MENTFSRLSLKSGLSITPRRQAERDTSIRAGLRLVLPRIGKTFQL
jgi:hypothetical protein